MARGIDEQIDGSWQKARQDGQEREERLSLQIEASGVHTLQVLVRYYPG